MFEKIRSYLAAQLDISPDEITRETTFESLGIDSSGPAGLWQGCTTRGDSGALLPAIRYSGEEIPTEGAYCIV